MASILLVDDDEDLSEMLNDVLQMQGHAVTVELTGQGALDQMKAKTFDLVLLDWQLPDMPGLEVCRHYRESGATHGVLMLTGMRDQSSKDSCIQAGVDAILTKPFTLDQLLPEVKRLLTGSSPTP